jgi:predicted esterase YcpF (UPF0227 family)
METKFYYIHGLGSSKESFKFLKLKKQYTNIECFDWSINDDMFIKIFEWSKIINSNGFENTCVIASSTGANFAYQLRLICKPNYIFLVLINPLLDIDDIYDKSIIPKQLIPYLIEKIQALTDSLILIGSLDTVIDYKNYSSFVKNNNQIIIDRYSTHKFEFINLYYKDIDKLINNIHL